MRVKLRRKKAEVLGIFDLLNNGDFGISRFVCLQFENMTDGDYILRLHTSHSDDGMSITLNHNDVTDQVMTSHIR